MLTSLARLLLGLSTRVSRAQYLRWGLGLMLLKYLGEAAIYHGANGELLMPWQFLNPLIQQRYPRVIEADWFYAAVAAWSLPFMWIGASMSLRRAADAGRSPWWALLFFVPGVNLAVMLALAALPTSPQAKWGEDRERAMSRFASPLAIAGLAVALGTLFAYVWIETVRSYGMSLFVGPPVLVGAICGFWLNRGPRPRGFFVTAGYAALVILLIHLAILIFALEGFVCLLMSFPFATALAVFGSIIGAGIARYGRPARVSPLALVLALPLMPLVEAQTSAPFRDVVLSSVEIAVPPEQVWPNVVKFTDLPPATDWLFKLGVAHPLRARIEGSGVGAVRHCEFSTGAFVEPITAWEEPSRLAFDVRFQPRPMTELSFYDRVDAPHLDGFFRSKRGEFRLVRLPSGGTRLEGRTWYEMDIHPGWYWRLYGRWFIHRIHQRVLEHVRALSEGSPRAE